MKKTLILIAIFLLLTGCGQEETPVLRLGTMPTYSGAIYAVGIEEGFFEEAGLSVELSVFRSARDRDGAIAAGELDASMTDIMGAVNLAAKGFSYVITSREQDALGIVTVEGQDNNGITIGMSENTVTEFVVDHYMTGTYEKVNILSVPDRMGAILGGNLSHGVFPQPFMGIIVGKGGQVVHSTSDDDLYPVVLAFDESYLRDHSDAVEAFYEGYKNTVAYMQTSDYDLYKEALVIHGLATEESVDLYRLPVDTYGLTAADQKSYDRIIDWMLTKSLLETPISYEDMVNLEYVD